MPPATDCRRGNAIDMVASWMSSTRRSGARMRARARKVSKRPPRLPPTSSGICSKHPSWTATSRAPNPSTGKPPKWPTAGFNLALLPASEQAAPGSAGSCRPSHGTEPATSVPGAERRHCGSARPTIHRAAAAPGRDRPCGVDPDQTALPRPLAEVEPVQGDPTHPVLHCLRALGLPMARAGGWLTPQNSEDHESGSKRDHVTRNALGSPAWSEGARRRWSME